jgi:hypothetical protein
LLIHKAPLAGLSRDQLAGHAPRGAEDKRFYGSSQLRFPWQHWLLVDFFGNEGYRWSTCGKHSRELQIPDSCFAHVSRWVFNIKLCLHFVVAAVVTCCVGFGCLLQQAY